MGRVGDPDSSPGPGENFSLKFTTYYLADAYSYGAADVHGAMGCGQKTFTQVWK